MFIRTGQQLGQWIATSIITPYVRYHCPSSMNTVDTSNITSRSIKTLYHFLEWHRRTRLGHYHCSCCTPGRKAHSAPHYGMYCILVANGTGYNAEDLPRSTTVFLNTKYPAFFAMVTKSSSVAGNSSRSAPLSIYVRLLRQFTWPPCLICSSRVRMVAVYR